jgi:hypothetical protein
MDVADLAPALLALDASLQRANSLLNGEMASVRLEVRSLSTGKSFEITLSLSVLIEGRAVVLPGDFFTPAAAIRELFWGARGLDAGASLFGTLRRSLGRNLKRIGRQDDSVVVDIDGARLRMAPKVFDLYNDALLRDHLAAMVRPVTRDGIDRIEFCEGTTVLATVEKGEAANFEHHPEDTATTAYLIPRQRLKLVRPNFSARGKWMLDDGEKKRWYTIADEIFNREVRQGFRRFGAGDLIECEVRLTQTYDDDGILRLDYLVTCVLRHTPGAQQGSLLPA